MKRLIAAAVLAAVCTAPASAAVLYSNDFDGSAIVGAGVTVSALDNGGLEDAVDVNSVGLGNWQGQYFANRSSGNPAAASTLTLSNLLPHTQVSISFILGFLESWDSFDGGCCAPDNLDISIDGVKVATLTARNALGGVLELGGGTLIVERGQVNGNIFYSDTLADMSTAPFLSFAHTGSTLTLAIQAGGAGWQGSSDEAWGIDALSITYDGNAPAVPEPSSWALMLGGAGLLAAFARRRASQRREG